MRVRALIGLLVLFLLAGCSSSPDPATTHLNSARRLFQAGKTRKAGIEIGKALTAAPSSYSTYLAAMALYDRHDQREDAARVGEALIAQAESSKLDRKISRGEKAALHLAIGELYWKTKNLVRAERNIRAALKLILNSPHTLNELGYFYADKGIHLKEALKLTRRAVRLAPDDAGIIDSLGWVQYRLGMYDDAARTLRKAVALMPNDADLRYHLGAAYAKAARPAAARIELEKALILDPGKPEASSLLKRLSKSS
jgi:Tfp pilus assembly protein PilF